MSDSTFGAVRNFRREKQWSILPHLGLGFRVWGLGSGGAGLQGYCAHKKTYVFAREVPLCPDPEREQVSKSRVPGMLMCGVSGARRRGSGAQRLRGDITVDWPHSTTSETDGICGISS